MTRLFVLVWFVLLLTLFIAPPASARQPTISISTTPTFGAFGSLTGTTTGVNPSTHAVATYIHVEGLGWYVKPTKDFPTVPIQPDGSFTVNVTTGGLDPYATWFVVALVPVGCAVPTPLGAGSLDRDHPCFLAVDVLSRPGPILDFAGRKWAVKVAPLPVGPENNYFESSNAFVDAQGRLNLTVSFSGGVWRCAEVVLLEPLGYGTYWFTTDSRQDLLDPNLTFGAFTWDSFGGYFNREIDFEDSRWGNPNSTTDSDVVVQPYGTPGNLFKFKLPDLSSNSTLTRFMDWQPNEITFSVEHGLVTPCGTPTPNSVFHHVYLDNPSANHFVPDEGDAQFRFNLWINTGSAPANGQTATVVISDFRFTPMRSAFPIGCTHAAMESLTVIGGTTALNQVLTLGVDNPSGTQPAASTAVLAISIPTAAPLACGPMVPGWGQNGGAGELLLHPTANPIILFGQNPWAGTGYPVPFALPIPNTNSLVGERFHVQGAILAPGSSHPVGLTEGRELCIGS